MWPVIYKFKIKLLCNEEEFFCTKTEFLTFKTSLPWAKLDIVQDKYQIF